MGLLDGVQNFTPAFTGQQLALQAGSRIAAGYQRGVDNKNTKRQLDFQEQQYTAEQMEQMETQRRLDEFKNYTMSGDAPPNSVARANHVISKLTSDPSWLADPRTSAAANSVFAAASKVVSMNLELERVKNSSTTAQAEQSLLAQQLKMAGEVARSNPDSIAEMYAKDENGTMPISDVRNFSKIAALHKQFVGTQGSGKLVIERLQTEGGQPVDVLRNTEGVQYTVVGNQDQKQQAIVDQLDAKEKSALSLFYNKEAAKLEAEAADLERGTDRDKQDAAGLKAQAQTYRQKLSSLGAPNSPAATNKKPTRAIAADYVKRLGKEKAIEALKQEGYDLSGYAD